MNRPLGRTAQVVRIEVAPGVTLVGDLWGAGGDPFVLMTHGGGQTRHSWGSTAAMLAARGYEVLSLDMRGHGDSGWSPDGVYQIERYAADVAAVVRRRAAGPAVLIGASMGGLASLVAAPELREQVAALILVDVAARVRAEGAERILGFMRRHIGGFSTLEEAADAIAAYRPGRPRPKDHSGLAKNLRFRDGRYAWHWDPAILGRRDAGGDALPHAILDAAAEAVTTPTLLVHGRLSDVVDDASIAHLQERIAHLQVSHVRDAGHMIVGDNNAVFEATILDFLERLPGTPAEQRGGP